MATKPITRPLVIEPPTTKAQVDFIDRAFLEISIADGKLFIEVKATHGEGTSEWDEHYFEVELPVQEPPATICDTDGHEFDENECVTCHIPTPEGEKDAS